MTSKPTVKVLHREGSPSSSKDSPSSPPDLQQLQAEVASLKQRLEQTKAAAAADRKRLTDDVRLERAGRERAEELLVKQAKELEAATAAKGRLEEAFSRSMSELRYTRLQYNQSETTIQQLLRELMLLRKIVSELTSSNGSGAATVAASDAAASQPANSSAAAGATAAAAGGGSSKRMSKSKLLGELQQLRQAKAAADMSREELLTRLGALEAEKERAEESQDMISRQTAQLLDDKRKLLKDLGSKDDAVRNLEAGLDHLQHQLELALTDRQLLLEELAKADGSGADLAALAAAMDAEGYGDEEAEPGQQQLDPDLLAGLKPVEQSEEGLGPEAVAA